MRCRRSVNHRRFPCISMPCKSTRRRWKNQGWRIKNSQVISRFKKKVIPKLLWIMPAKQIPIQIQGVASQETIVKVMSTKKKRASSVKLVLQLSNCRSLIKLSKKLSTGNHLQSLRAQLLESLSQWRLKIQTNLKVKMSTSPNCYQLT